MDWSRRQTSIITLFFIFWSCVTLVPFGTRAQTAPAVPKLFVQCNARDDCYDDYLRTELSFFSFVRDRFLADVLILITEQDNGGGGARFTATLSGMGKYAGITDTMRLDVLQTDTEQVIRSRVADKLKLALLPYVQRAGLLQSVELHYPQREAKDLLPEDDPWHYWVFNLGADGSVEGESQRQFISIDNFLTVNRITDKSKWNFDFGYDFEERRFELETGIERVFVDRYGMLGSYVKSLTEHWSMGVLGQLEHDKFRNLAFTQRLAPVIEYNIFPFRENTHRQLRFAYQAGGHHLQYILPTVFDRQNELRPYNRLSVIAELAQKWGSLRSVATASAFMDNWQQYRLSIDTDLTWRITKGLGIIMSVEAAQVRDQISLAKATFDSSTFLLQGQQLPTQFTYELQFGLVFTFGSIHNAVVNPRMGQVE
jgi:hypothetical protein